MKKTMGIKQIKKWNDSKKVKADKWKLKEKLIG